MDTTNLLLVLLGLTVGLSALAFWLWMLVDCLRNERSEGYDKLVWVVVIVATKLLGAAIYYFVRRPNRPRLEAG